MTAYDYESAIPTMLDSELTKEILKLGMGAHLCLFYEKDPADLSGIRFAR